MAKENSLWGVPHIHSELLKLGFEISESTVRRYMPKKKEVQPVKTGKLSLKIMLPELSRLIF